MEYEIDTPNPSVSCSENNFCSLNFSSILPSPGFTNRFDPEGAYIAIGCNDGERLLFSIAESILNINCR